MWQLRVIALSFLVYCGVESFLKNVLAHQLILKKRVQDVSGMTPMKTGKESKNKNKKNEDSIFVPRNFKRILINAGVNLRPDEFMKLWVAITIVPSGIFALLGKNILTVLVLFLIGLVSPVIVIKRKLKQQVQVFGEQLGDALMIISNSLRAGFTFEQALGSVAKDFPNPIGAEFTSIIREVEIGESIETSMMKVAKKMESEEMELLTTAVSIQRQVGGNLSEIIDNISETIQARIQLQRKVKTLTAQGEISGKVIALLPVAILVMFSMINPEYMKPMFSTTFGYALMFVSIVLETIGYLSIKKIINIEGI